MCLFPPTFQHLRDFDTSVIHYINAVVLSSSNLFVYCFFGLLASESHLKMVFCLYSCDWTRIPIEYQKYLILMIANIQKPIRYRGMKVFVLDLETFCSVSNKFLCTFAHAQSINRFFFSVFKYSHDVLYDVQEAHRMNELQFSLLFVTTIFNLKTTFFNCVVLSTN